MVGTSSLMHFMVDGLCLCCLYLLLPVYVDSGAVGVILTYNILAFMTQPLSGLWVDRIRERHRVLLSAIVLLVLAVGVAIVSSWSERGGVPALFLLTAILLGLGNSLFHVWGGKQTAVETGNDIRALGVFVSTGALGLAVGLVFCSWSLVYGLLLAIVATAIIYVRCDVRRESTSVISPNTFVPRRWLTSERAWMIVVLVMLFVAYRSYTGEVFSRGIAKSEVLILAIGVVSMLGKMAGGWIALRMGVLKSLAVVLAGVALCILFRGDSVAILLAGIFLMNCTMPVTLYLANDVLPGREGLAFGLLAAALIPGYLLVVYM